MAWTIEYARSVQKEIRRLNPQTRKRIRDFLQERLAKHDNPRSMGKALKGSQLGELWRYRVGDWRLICEIQDRRLVVLLLHAGHRREIYRD